MGLVVPSRQAEGQGLKEGDEVVVEVRRRSSVREVYGIARKIARSGQEIKDELRRGGTWI